MSSSKNRLDLRPKESKGCLVFFCFVLFLPSVVDMRLSSSSKTNLESVLTSMCKYTSKKVPMWLEFGPNKHSSLFGYILLISSIHTKVLQRRNKLVQKVYLCVCVLSILCSLMMTNLRHELY